MTTAVENITTEDDRAAPGFAEFRFDDGALVQVSAYGGQVAVLQMQASTQGRGAAFLTPDQAEQLADAIAKAGNVARDQSENAPAPSVPALSAAPTSAAPASAAPAGLSAEEIASIVGAVVDKKFAERDAAGAS